MDKKNCVKCHKEKSLDDFYKAMGRPRSKCKQCTIKDNYKHQQKTKAWENRVVDKDANKAYMKLYYENNKAKFAEHRKKFKENHPDYYRDYARNKKLKPL